MQLQTMALARVWMINVASSTRKILWHPGKMISCQHLFNIYSGRVERGYRCVATSPRSCAIIQKFRSGPIYLMSPTQQNRSSAEFISLTLRKWQLVTKCYYLIAIPREGMAKISVFLPTTNNILLGRNSVKCFLHVLRVSERFAGASEVSRGWSTARARLFRFCTGRST